ncbi:hypothetical protein SISNIDRAFT_467335 [Sistotremastrum niveocremeum HHB9708]|uniref:F-box domain-containing protein n=1 Tax=Sistotremastrum niveocremeum HHB9708 TaxID=1314777 RepID=A0A164SRE7_9AGAM|nr:hypothetical protein SISNIDRAFT_467335 [Sistotremastrum niveocremeum HHB9708]
MAHLPSVSGHLSETQSTVAFEPQHIPGHFRSLTEDATFNVQNTLNDIEDTASQCDSFFDYSVKQRQNLSAPVGRLTNELIVQILKYSWHHQYPDPYHGEPRLNKIPPAYSLCTRWRNVALQSPCFWCTIYLPAPPEMFQLFQSRSQSSKLDIIVSTATMPQGRDELVVLAEIGVSIRSVVTRIKSLDINWGRWCPGDQKLNQFLKKEFSGQQFSSLKLLSITNELYDVDCRSTLNTPVLEDFKYYGDLKGIPRATAPNLSKLLLQGTMYKPKIILDTLSLFPAVEHLTIRDCCDSGYTLRRPQHAIVSFERLRSLDIDALHLIDLQYVLEHLIYPPSASIIFEVHRNPSKKSEVEKFLGPRMATATELRVTQGWMHSYSLVSSPGQSFQVKHFHADGDIASLQKLAAYPTALSRLELRFKELPPVNEMVTTLRLWNRIAHISIQTDEEEVKKLFMALQHASVLCPLLETMDFRGSSFSYPEMVQFLRFRKDQGAPLRELTITKQNPDVPIELFSTLVARVLHLAIDKVPVNQEKESKSCLMCCMATFRALTSVLGSSTGYQKESLLDVETTISDYLPPLSTFLKQQRNMCAPIGRLSDELVIEVLHYSLYDIRNWAGWYPGTRVIPPAFYLCTRWRNITLHCASLWETVYLPAPPDMFEAFKRRGGLRTLRVIVTTVCMTGEMEEEAPVLDQLSNNLRDLAPRISELFITWEEYTPEDVDLNDFLESEFKNVTFSSLKALHITDYRHRGEPSFTLDTPILRELEFYGSPDPLPLVSPGCLVKLCLSGVNYEPVDILDILSLYPYLEHFSVSDPCDWEGWEHEYSIQPPVSLRNLKSFEISRYPLNSLNHLFTSLDVPASVHWKLSGCSHNDEGLDFASFLGLRMSAYDGIRIAENSHSYYGVAFTLMTCLEPRIEIGYSASASRNDAKLPSLVRIASYPCDLKRIELLTKWLPESEELVEAFRRWAGITYIKGCSPEADFERLLSALTTTPDIPCPLLETLDCTGMKLNVQRMKKFFECRIEEGVPVRQLIVDPGILGGIDLVEELAGLVEIVPANEADLESTRNRKP